MHMKEAGSVPFFRFGMFRACRLVMCFLNAALGTRSAVLFIIQKHWHEGLDDGTFLAMEQVQVLG